MEISEESSTRTRRIVLDKQEYSFPFNNPSGARVKCTVTEGAGTVTLYRINSKGEKAQVGDSHSLSLKLGESFYVSLNTEIKDSKWEIAFRGKGAFKLELPYELLYNKRAQKGKLSKEFDEYGRKKE